MTEVISVQFREGGKVYFFDPGTLRFSVGDAVVVETSKGLELGRCTAGNHKVDDHAVVQPLKTVVRAATQDDLRVEEINKKREKEAFGICEEKIAKHGLEMKLVDVECSFEGNKILFFFTADGRVDFRELVKDLAGVFRTRIELRQIGVRDEAKMLGGIGICGQPFCCSRFLTEFQPVSTKMAKTQSLSLNPTKISGCCGRLMCCLRYEQEAYEDLIKHMPKNGCFVETEEGYGNVVGMNLLRQNVKVRLDGPGEAVVHNFDVADIAEVPGGRPPEGETPPHVLQPRVKEPVEEPEDEWAMPPLFSDSTADVSQRQSAPVREEKSEKPQSSRRRRGGHGGEKKPQTQGEKKPQQGEKKQQAQGKKPRVQSQQTKAQSEKAKPAAEKKIVPKAESAEKKAVPKTEGGEKKKNYRRRYHARPKKAGEE
ncbi:MAG: hypothetical protein KBS46_05015 [Clostridiales bacterium]|nr:hypothetical protein [Candidatus Apopatocola equi]